MAGRPGCGGAFVQEAPRELLQLEHWGCPWSRDPDGRVIGIARGVADGVRGYLTECKLDPARQGPAAVTHIDGRIEHDQFGIAKEMAERVISALANLGCERIDASAYGTEVDFCEELGFKRAAGIVPMSLDVGSKGQDD